MKKKIISAVIAFAMLSQVSAFASVSLKDFVQSNPLTRPYLDSDNVLNYSNVDPSNITVELTTTMKGAGTTYAGTSATAPLSLAYENNSFDYKVDLDMSPVSRTFNNLYSNGEAALASETDLLAAGKNSVVSGTFNVVVNYDSNIAFDAANFNLTQTGNTVSNIFKFDNTKIKFNAGSITVPFTVADGITIQTLKDNPAYLNNLSITLTGATACKFGVNLKATASLTGVTNFADNGEVFGRINYKSNDTDSYVFVAAQQGGSSGSSSSSGNSGNAYKPSTVIVNTIVDGNVSGSVNTVLQNNSNVLKLDTIKQPYKEGYVFVSWYDNPTFSGDPLSGDIPIDSNTNIYAKFVNTRVPEQLDSEKHIAYVFGYPDGTVGPERNITREEVASIFYRLLDADFKATVETTENNFTDVAADRWSNTAVSTMAKAGLVNGMTDGIFDPSSPITRAQFVTIAANFVGAEDSVPNVNSLTDIQGHWAEKYILTASSRYWISGYPDKTFKPDAYITRAEAMAVVNRILVRYVNAAENCEGAKVWPDNNTSDWFYFNVIEATSDHNFTRLTDGYHETWTK